LAAAVAAWGTCPWAVAVVEAAVVVVAAAAAAVA